jgi:copper homeostasis protein
MIFELAVFHPDAVAIAQECNVSRIELCDNYQVGGITPSIDNFSLARKNFDGPIMVMIRPQAGAFVYDDKILNQMLEEIKTFDELGADGFVFGCLTSDNNVNTVQLEQLVNAADKKPVTFHRAIDEVNDYEKGIQDLIRCGVTSVLTTGKMKSALEGKDVINKMIHQYGTQLNFIAGGGVRSSNISELLMNSNITQIHSAAITQNQNFIADEEEVRKIIEIVNYA